MSKSHWKVQLTKQDDEDMLLLVLAKLRIKRGWLLSAVAGLAGSAVYLIR
jgi:hypothetical protein